MTGPEAKAVRKSLKMSQIDFAEALGVSKRTVENWDQGRRDPDEDNERKIRALKKE